MAAKKTLVCCLMFSCFVFMAKADTPIRPATSKAERSAFEEGTIEKRSSQELEDECFEFGNHKYVLSRNPYVDIYTSQNVCKNHGGYLVEVNDKSEYEAIKELILTSAVNKYGVVLSATDENHDGYWTFLSGAPLPVQDWVPGYPVAGQNCMALSMGTPLMFSIYCKNTNNGPYRFLCEIPL